MSTSFMFLAAELSTVISICVVIAISMVMFLLIIKLLRQDLNESSGVTRVGYVPPNITMSKVRIPFTLDNIMTNDQSKYLELSLKIHDKELHSIRDLEPRLFWAVDITSFFHILRGPGKWFHEALKFGNVFGSDGCRYISGDAEVNVSTSTIKVQYPKEYDSWDFGPAPRTRYPLVIICYALSQELGQYVVIHVVHIRDSGLKIQTRILNTYIKTLDDPGRSVELKPLFSTDDLCVVCQESIATRVLLPCRHACVCNKCFFRLTNKCPMCRTFIHSYFLKEQEDENEQQVIQEDEVLSWGDRILDLNHRVALRMGLQENN